MIRWPTLSLMLLAATVAFPARGASTLEADRCYAEAREARARLKGDEHQRKFRHAWINVAKKFEKVAARHPKTDRAPEALYTAGELYSELSRFSQNPEDLDTARTNFQQLLAGWARHRLADDAAYALGRILADRDQDLAAARKVIASALAQGAGDKEQDLKALLKVLPVEAPRAVAPGKAKREADTEARSGATKANAEAGAAKARPSAPAAAEQKAAARAGAGKPPERPAQREAAEDEEGDLAEAARSTTSPLANAIARLNAATSKLRDDDERVTPSGGVQARAARVLRPLPRDEAVPEPAELASAEEVAEGPGLPTLDAIREQLRDVRVGERPAKGTLADARLLKLRMEQSDRQHGGEGITLAEQLGLKVRRVVIDAGHGGHDTGAIGPSGIYEKDAALGMALALKEKLEAAGLEVLLTRDDDSFVKLEDRSRIANRARGDLFVSIHCNAAPSPKMRGIETYTLNVASNRYAVRLAARENASSEKGMGDLQYILADLTTKANTDESRRLAAQVQAHLVGSLSAKHKGVRDLGTKEALFYVLLGAKMPAILVETSFISNPEDEKLLGSPGYQNEVAQALTDAVKDFLALRERVARVD